MSELEIFVNSLVKKISKRKNFPKWSHRTIGGNVNKLKKIILKLLKFISGNDLISMLKYILSESKQEALCLEKTNALRNIGIMYSCRSKKYFKQFVRRRIVKCLIDSGTSALLFMFSFILI